VPTLWNLWGSQTYILLIRPWNWSKVHPEYEEDEASGLVRIENRLGFPNCAANLVTQPRK
jgi:hypothetical protein